MMFHVPYIREDFCGFLAENEELTRTVVFLNLVFNPSLSIFIVFGRGRDPLFHPASSCRYWSLLNTLNTQRSIRSLKIMLRCTFSN